MSRQGDSQTSNIEDDNIADILEENDLRFVRKKTFFQKRTTRFRTLHQDFFADFD